MLLGEQIRNFGFIAHIDAGKTTTTERLLYITGSNYRIGEVDEGTTTTDWMLEEKERGITITSAAVSCFWKNAALHIIDTPGHVDFIAEVHRCLRVLDGVVVVFCGVSGVQTQSEAVWKEADSFKIPRLAYINKLDRIGADFANVVNEIETKLNSRPLPISIPYYEQDTLEGIIDLVTMKLITYQQDSHIDQIREIPHRALETANQYRENMINVLTEIDDEILAAALENQLTGSLLIQSIQTATINLSIIPVIAGSSYKNVGIPNLVDAIVQYLPSPINAPLIEAHHIQSDQKLEIAWQLEGPPLLYLFKVQYNRDKGLQAFVRIYQGKIKTGMTLINMRNGKEERVMNLLKIYGDKCERINEAIAGDIVIITGFKSSTTGDTLGDKNNQIGLEKLAFPEPVIFVRVEPKNTTDMDKFSIARQNLLREDPTIVFKEDQETGETLIGGMGELHLEIFLERIRNDYKIDIKKGHPQVAYRETPLGEGQYHHEIELKIGGTTNHIQIDLMLKPLPRNSGLKIKSNLIPKKASHALREAIEQGIKNASISGPEGAYPVIDCQFEINQISYEEDKNYLKAVSAAASMCTTYLLRKVGMKLLEPIMRLEVNVPENFTGGVIGDLQSRQGMILDIIKKQQEDLILAKAPLKQLFGYATALRSLSQGKGQFTIKFLEFDAPHSD